MRNACSKIASAGVNLVCFTFADPLVNDGGLYTCHSYPRHHSSITSKTKGLQILHTQTFLYTRTLPSSFSYGRINISTYSIGALKYIPISSRKNDLCHMIAVLTFVVIKWVVNVCDLAEKDGDYGTSNQSFKCDNYVSATNDTNTVVGITLSNGIVIPLVKVMRCYLV